MTISQADNFYAQDKKKYDLQYNKEFLTWLNTLIENGYHVPLKVGQMQELINNIATWYEMKYPDRKLKKEKVRSFPDVESISDDIRQLYYCLPHDQLSLMECGYRAKRWNQHLVYEDGKELHKEKGCRKTWME